MLHYTTITRAQSPVKPQLQVQEASPLGPAAEPPVAAENMSVAVQPVDPAVPNQRQGQNDNLQVKDFFCCVQLVNHRIPRYFHICSFFSFNIVKFYVQTLSCLL